MDNSMGKLEYSEIRSVSVVDAVKEWIIDQLIKGNLKPGGKLPTEAELCANMGASRNSVREAIKQLEAYGVVYIKRAEGTFVTDRFVPKMLSPLLYSMILQNNRWDNFVELRKAIDIGTLYVLMDRKQDSEKLAQLSQALADFENVVVSGADVTRITEADCEFHNVVISLTDNPQLITLSEYINLITVPSREKTTELVISCGKLADYISLHREMYEIIVERDKSNIEQTVTSHYRFWEKLMD